MDNLSFRVRMSNLCLKHNGFQCCGSPAGGNNLENITICTFCMTLSAAQSFKTPKISRLRKALLAVKELKRHVFHLLGHCGCEKQNCLGGFEHPEYARKTSLEMSCPTQ